MFSISKSANPNTKGSSRCLPGGLRFKTQLLNRETFVVFATNSIVICVAKPRFIAAVLGLLSMVAFWTFARCGQKDFRWEISGKGFFDFGLMSFSRFLSD